MLQSWSAFLLTSLCWLGLVLVLCNTRQLWPHCEKQTSRRWCSHAAFFFFFVDFWIRSIRLISVLSDYSAAGNHGNHWADSCSVVTYHIVKDDTNSFQSHEQTATHFSSFYAWMRPYIFFFCFFTISWDPISKECFSVFVLVFIMPLELERDAGCVAIHCEALLKCLLVSLRSGVSDSLGSDAAAKLRSREKMGHVLKGESPWRGEN